MCIYVCRQNIYIDRYIYADICVVTLEILLFLFFQSSLCTLNVPYQKDFFQNIFKILNLKEQSKVVRLRKKKNN